MVKLFLGRSDTLKEHYKIPDDELEIVELGPFEYVELTYEFLRTGPEGEMIGCFNEGVWWLDGNKYPFSDLDVWAEGTK